MEGVVATCSAVSTTPDMSDLDTKIIVSFFPNVHPLN